MFRLSRRNEARSERTPETWQGESHRKDSEGMEIKGDADDGGREKTK